MKQAEQPSPKQEEIVVQNKYPNDYDWIIEPSKTTSTKGLAISNYIFAQNQKQLKEKNFGAVVSVFGESELKIEGDIKHFRILIGDSPSENIKCFFDSANKFITENIKYTNVLVHCKAGVSRSATIIAAYLINAKRVTVNDAISLMRSKRYIVEPNKGFMKQLKQYQRQLKEKWQKEQKCQIY